MRPYTFPPLELALETDWDRKLSELAARSVSERITLVSGVPGWLLLLFQRILELTGKRSIAEVWPHLELVVHGGVKFDPYRESFQAILGSPAIRLQETYPCSEGFIAFGDPATGLLRLVFDHRDILRIRPGRRTGLAQSDAPLAGDGADGDKLRDRRFDVRGHVGSRDRRHGSIRIARSPVDQLHGPDSLHALGLWRTSDQRRGRSGDGSGRIADTGASVREWHVGPVFVGAMGYHQFVVEFLNEPADLERFRESPGRRALDIATPITWPTAYRAWGCRRRP